MINITVNIVVIWLFVLGLASLYRAFKGPTATDRVAAMNMIVTMVVLYTIVFSYLNGQYFYIDVALVFSLAAFISTLCILKFLREGRLF